MSLVALHAPVDAIEHVARRLSGGSSVLHIKRVGDAHELMDILLCARSGVVLIEHDPEMFERTDVSTFEELVELLQNAGSVRDVIYASAARDRVFDFIAGLADKLIHVERVGEDYRILEVGRPTLQCPCLG